MKASSLKCETNMTVFLAVAISWKRTLEQVWPKRRNGNEEMRNDEMGNGEMRKWKRVLAD